MLNGNVKAHLSEWNLNTVLLAMGLIISLTGAAVVVRGEITDTQVRIENLKATLDEHRAIPAHVEGRITMTTLDTKIDHIINQQEKLLRQQKEFNSRISELERDR